MPNATFDEQIYQSLIPSSLSPLLDTYTSQGDDNLPSYYSVSDLAVSTIGVACDAVLSYAMMRSGARRSAFHIDRRLASLWFDMTVVPKGWDLPPVWDSIAGVYRAKDRFIRLHTNVPHHKSAALAVLSCAQDRDAVAHAVSKFDATTLETLVVEEGGAAAALRSEEEWKNHEQGSSVSTEPLIAWMRNGFTSDKMHTPTFDPARPLEGLKVLDLTRVLAGPVCTRFLALFGANVLRIDPPNWNEGLVEIEVTAGKRCAGLDLKETSDRGIFESLIRDADILVHGYRKGALEGLGYDDETLSQLNPRLIDIALNAYGWTGPWQNRRGFDSLVQMSCGIARHGMDASKKGHPVPLPVQALDHGTGYLMAAAALSALSARQESGDTYSARLSLARTAHLLMNAGHQSGQGSFRAREALDMNTDIEMTSWGPLNRVNLPLSHDTIKPGFTYAARRFRSDPPTFTN